MSQAVKQSFITIESSDQVLARNNSLNDLTTKSESQFAPFAAKMQDEGVSDLMIHIFRHYYEQLVAGETGYISSNEAGPVHALPDISEVEQYDSAGQEALSRAVVLKLNGGLGTSMGMCGPKSLLKVKDELSFLDIIVHQVLHLREQHNVRLPLILMNSFNTEYATYQALAKYPTLQQDVPLSFLQNMEPKIAVDTLTPVEWTNEPSKEWCPPGHGDIYAALLSSGLLDQLLDAGYEYAFVSNSDNLGAVLDTTILGYFAQEKLPFLMEVADRTRADCKGGHLACRADGQLILRESAQCPPDEQAIFQDIERYRYFNTNNLWIHLPTLRQVLEERKGVLGLPLIRNQKPVDPKDAESTQVYQLETAMGAAIGVFSGARALRVPRSRFVPIKKNNDLLLLWSDVYQLTKEYHLQLNPARRVDPIDSPPLIFLDERYYRLIDDLAERFPQGAPSLLQCTELRVEGDVYFGGDVSVNGEVKISYQGSGTLTISDGQRL